MAIYSLCFQAGSFKKVKVEGSFIRGIPRVSIIGQADQVVKESVLRVKAALLANGYRWSLKKHLVISLQPSDIRKNESGLDLALAMVYLNLTNQIDLLEDQDHFFFGELSLNGSIAKASLRERGLVPFGEEHWYGNFFDGEIYGTRVTRIQNLSEIDEETFNKVKVDLKPLDDRIHLTRSVKYIDPSWIKVFELMVFGEHSALFCGPNNRGVEDFFKLLVQNLPQLPERLRSNVVMIPWGKGYIRPFGNLTGDATLSQIRGRGEGQGLGVKLRGGAVYVSSFFDLTRGVKAALAREVLGPHLHQGTGPVLVGQTALCPCGEFDLKGSRVCQASLTRCRSVLTRISGDDLRLFQMVLTPQVSFLRLYSHDDVCPKKISSRLDKACEVKTARGQLGPNSEVEIGEILEGLSPEVEEMALLPHYRGPDRVLAILRVARSLADLEGKKLVGLNHVHEAKKYAYQNFKTLVESL